MGKGGLGYGWGVSCENGYRRDEGYNEVASELEASDGGSGQAKFRSEARSICDAWIVLGS